MLLLQRKSPLRRSWCLLPSQWHLHRQSPACNLHSGTSTYRRNFHVDVTHDTNPSTRQPSKPYYITTPIFYVNAAPHVGHLYSLVLADVIKRWQELLGKKAVLCTGTDEHGMKVQQAAEAANENPKAFCDFAAEPFKDLAKQANISNDHFIRTTDDAHKEAVQAAWLQLKETGYIYTAKHEGWYSISDETFYTEPQIHDIVDPGTGRKIKCSKETGKKVEWTSEINYHFRLSEFKDKLLKHYDTNPNFVVPYVRFQSVRDEVASGLGDLSISRPRERLSWGIPVPNDPEHTIYVWLDALINYLTVTGYPWTPRKESVGGWPADVHVIGKDIVRFHCIYWPAFLLALGLPLPKQILTHAHWTMNRRKMSKSEGNVVNPFYAMQRFGVETMRYYLCHDGGIVDDGDYSNEYIYERYRVQLQNQLGNLLNRTTSQSFNLREAVSVGLDIINANDSELTEEDTHQITVLREASFAVYKRMDKLEVNLALKEILNVLVETNKYISSSEPWNMVAKSARPLSPTKESEGAYTPPTPLPSEPQPRRLNVIIYLCAEGLRIAGIMLQAFMPEKSTELLDHLNVEKGRRSLEFADLGGDELYGAKRKKRIILFPPLTSYE